MRRILIVEDDERLGEHLKLNLELRDYTVNLASSAETAKALICEEIFVACLLDVELPDGDGLELCRLVRMHDPSLPILMISARHEESIVVKGLDLGADDYLRKPFGMRELAVRLEKLIAKHRRSPEELMLGGLRLDYDKRQAFYKDQDLSLSRREYRLLVIFANYPGRVYTRAQLVDAVHGEENIQERTIDSHISHIRAKLRAQACEEIQIYSVYGSGYRLEVRTERHASKDQF
jgi:DNA-binding response OmpR family regulator